MRLLFELKFILVFLFLLFCIFCTNVFISYDDYKSFKLSKRQDIKGAILVQNYIKTKHSRTYRVLNFKYKSFSIYTTVLPKEKFVKNGIYDFVIYNKNIGFKDYLSKKYYAPSYAFKQNGIYDNKIIAYFTNQHKNELTKQLYSALFFGTAMNKQLRIKLNLYGVSHLVAISGYHLGLIFTLLFFFFRYIYAFFQSRFFPWRDLHFDISILIFGLLFAYAYLLGFIPSFVRSLVMAIFAFVLLVKNVKILSFKSLILACCICLALYPRLLFSLGFFFSISGVYFIFLFAQSFKIRNFTEVVFLNIYVYSNMIIIVHFFYPQASYWQFSSLLANLLFVLFYPFMLFEHLLGYGDLLDNILIKLLDKNLSFYSFYTPAWLYYSFIFLSLFAYKWRILAFCLPVCGLLVYFFYAFSLN